MTTVASCSAAATTPLAPSPSPSPSLWLESRRFDLGFFILSGIGALLLLFPYMALGALAIIPIYNIYLVFFGLPHNYMTWATILPRSARSTINMDIVKTSALICLVICLLLPFSGNGPLRNWILTLISVASMWHAYRQHHGICKVYDAVQAKRTGDRSIYADRKAMNLFFGLASWAVPIWAFTHERISYLLSNDEYYDLVYPQIPTPMFHAYLVVTALVGVWAVKRGIFDRLRSKKHVPWPQHALMLMAIATYVVPYLVMPIEAMPLAVAIATIYHNVQYFGFVWMFERRRSDILVTERRGLQLPQRLVHLGAWKRWFGVALLYSFVVCFFYLAAPQQIGLTLIYFLGFAHYIIDGHIWRGAHNKLLGSVVNALAAQPAEVASAATVSGRRFDVPATAGQVS